jgi:Spy/CpxP family protein refolding chaperone
MKKYNFVSIAGPVICVFLAVLACAQERSGERRSNARDELQNLSEVQLSAAKALLAKYNPSTLTADDAKAIHRGMREIGIRGGRAEKDILTAAGFDPGELRNLDPPPDRRDGNTPGEVTSGKKEDGSRKKDPERSPGGTKYSIEQAISDNAQLHTIAFNGLAFLTGDFGAATFIPPGKVCDYFGFQYMRDIDAASKGHNPMFLNRVAGNVLHILSDEQKQIFLDLADKQAPQLEALARMRLPLIKAFHRQRDSQIPAGSSGLNKDAVMRAVGEIFALDAALSLRRAEAMGRVAVSLTPDQKAYLGKMKFGDFSTWPAMDERDKIRQQGRGRTKMYNVAYMTYASEFFSWTAGSIEADTYFCPERHGTYFGGFYMKDMPAMGKRDYDISTSVTGESGRTFLHDVLTPEQRKQIESILDLQRKALDETVTVRRAISRELRKYLSGQTPDEKALIALGRRYGELDGEMSWYYTMALARVNQTLTPQQRDALQRLRNLEGYESAPCYIYSEGAKINPELGNTDAFFFMPKHGD